MKAPKRLPTAQRQRQIAEAALRIISTRGGHRLTAAALADQVGIADGTIFRHFGNKGEIVDAAIDLFQAALESTFPAEDGEPLDRLALFFVNRLNLVRRNPDLLRLAFNDRLAEAAGEQGARRIGRLIQRSVTFVHSCLAEAQDRGAVPRDASPILLTWMVIGVIRGAATRGPQGAAGANTLFSTRPEQVWKQLERFLCSRSKETDQ